MASVTTKVSVVHENRRRLRSPAAGWSSVSSLDARRFASQLDDGNIEPSTRLLSIARRGRRGRRDLQIPMTSTARAWLARWRPRGTVLGVTRRVGFIHGNRLYILAV
jgi:hypothetical protein